MVGGVSRGLPAAHCGLSASPGEKSRWRSSAVLGTGGMVPCSPETSGTGTRQELGAMRGPQQAFSPGTGAGAEHGGGGLTSPRPQPREKTSQKFPSETPLMAHRTDTSPWLQSREPAPSQQLLELGSPGAESRLVPGKGGNRYEN